MDLFQKLRTINILSPNLELQKGLFLKRIGMLLEEGYSIKNTLLFLEKFEKKEVKAWIESIQTGLLSGSNFQEELGEIGFSEKVCSQIYFASQYGNYGQTITRCGQQILDEQETKKKMKSLLSYPTILLFFLLIMLLVMRFLILPNMEQLFASTGEEGGIYSNKLVSIIYYSPQIIVGFILLSLVGGFLVKRKFNKISPIEQVEFLMKIPFVTPYLKDYWTHFFFFEWGHLLRNGSSFHEVVSIMQGKGASPLLQETGEVLAGEMSLGKTMKEAFAVLPFFHEEALVVVAHGENLGQLSTEMLIYAEHCQLEFSRRIEKLLEKMQPVIFSFIALMIIAIYASMMLPIFSMMEGF